MTEEASRPQIGLDEFQRIDLRVARVIEAEAVPGATKLVKLRIDLGSELRQIVAGIAQAYAPEALVGASIVVVANLKPATVRGIESQGMLLAATPPEGQPVLVVLEREAPPGTRVR